MKDQSLFNVLSDSIKGARRLGQTARILSITGVNWALGERPPAPRLLRKTFESLGTTYIKLGQFIEHNSKTSGSYCS